MSSETNTVDSQIDSQKNRVILRISQYITFRKHVFVLEPRWEKWLLICSTSSPVVAATPSCHLPAQATWYEAVHELFLYYTSDVYVIDVHYMQQDSINQCTPDRTKSVPWHASLTMRASSFLLRWHHAFSAMASNCKQHHTRSIGHL